MPGMHPVKGTYSYNGILKNRQGINEFTVHLHAANVF
jgi:hypothetical protein